MPGDRQTLLVVHHTPSPAMQEMLEAVLGGAQHEELTGLEVLVRPALVADTVDLLTAAAVVLGTPANIGWMSGALKHFFDQVYYPCLTATQDLPFGLYVHGTSDLTGAVRSVQTVTTGMSWRPVAPPVEVVGPCSQEDLTALGELGATVGAYALGLVEP